MGGAAFERSHGDDFKAPLFFVKGHVSDQVQGHVEGQNVVWEFQRHIQLSLALYQSRYSQENDKGTARE